MKNKDEKMKTANLVPSASKERKYSFTPLIPGGGGRAPVIKRQYDKNNWSKKK